MAYIWINPVTAGMYKPDELNMFLSRHGYKRFEVSADWPMIVKEKYRLKVKESTHTVIDMRCPKIAELLKELGVSSRVTIPDIHPILIHCGQEGSEREDLLGEEKVITTPCQALADMGNALGLKDTRFIPWNQFLKSIGDEPKGILPKESPIPPGFFNELQLKTISLTGEEEIRDYFANEIPNDVQLVEMLYCKGGCHNGDGIRMCEL